MLKGGMGNLMKQAQKMQEQLQRAQAQLAEAEVTGESGAGLVKVTMNCRHDAKRIELDDSIMSEDKEMLEDLLTADVNEAVRKIEQHKQQEKIIIKDNIELQTDVKMPS